MNSRKTRLLFLFLGLLLVTAFQPPSALAQQNSELSIKCEDEDCTLSPPNAPLFAEDNLVPGETRTGIIHLKNAQEKAGCQIGLSAKRTSPLIQPDLAEQLILSLSRASEQLFTARYAALFAAQQPVTLTVVDPETTFDLVWQARFDPSTSNQYQNTSFSYDFQLTFTCDESIRAPVPTVKPSARPTAQPTQRPSRDAEIRIPTQAASPGDTTGVVALQPPLARQTTLQTGSVLGAATAAAVVASPEAQPLSQSTIFKLWLPEKVTTLPKSTKFIILGSYGLFSFGILFFFFWLLFKRKKKKVRSSDSTDLE